MQILIAEDDFTSRAMLGAVLKKSGYDVLETTNGSDAWAVLREADAPEIAILDWMMPEMDGLEVTRNVRAMESSRPPYIIMLTSKGEKADIISGLEAGADDYLSKPFHPGELRARVEVGRRLIEMRSELLKTRDALAHEATHDPLTGVLNRRAIQSALAQAFSRERRNHEGLAIGICDIDFFKKINDTRGHMAGDDVLCGFVRVLGAHLRDYDHLGRFGGEEFLVVMSGLKEGDAPSAFDRLRSAVAEKPIATRDGEVPVTVSIGARIVRDGDTIDSMILAADAALYRAKNEGRNRVCMDDGTAGVGG